MRYSSFIQAFLSQKRHKQNALALWAAAQPISLDEAKAELVALSHDYEVTTICPADASRALTLDDLWAIFESLEDIDDCRVIY